MGWEVTPSEGVKITSRESKNTDIEFPPNETTSDITYVVRYVDSLGDCGSKEITVKACGNMPCQLEQVPYSESSIIPPIPGDNYFYLFTYTLNERDCQFNVEELSPDNAIREIKVVTSSDSQYKIIEARFNDNPGYDRIVKVKVTLVNDCRAGDTCEGVFEFEQKGSLGPEPGPVGNCEETNMGSLSTSEVFRIAVNCTQLNNGLSSWRAPNSGWTISIENRLTDYYIPFNGIARIAVGQTEESTSLYVISYRAVNEGHMFYGKTKDRTQDSNILIPPKYRVTFKKCSIESSIPAGHQAVSKQKTHFQTSMLKGSENNLKQHNEHVEQCYSANTSINLTNKEVKFIIDSVCDWGGQTDPVGQVRYYGIKKTADGKPEHYTDKVGSNGNRYIVPVNIFRSSNNDDFSDYNPLTPLDSDMTFESLG